jgi:hypothetical protein
MHGILFAFHFNGIDLKKPFRYNEVIFVSILER